MPYCYSLIICHFMQTYNLLRIQIRNLRSKGHNSRYNIYISTCHYKLCIQWVISVFNPATKDFIITRYLYRFPGHKHTQFSVRYQVMDREKGAGGSYNGKSECGPQWVGYLNVSRSESVKYLFNLQISRKEQEYSSHRKRLNVRPCPHLHAFHWQYKVDEQINLGSTSLSSFLYIVQTLLDLFSF